MSNYATKLDLKGVTVANTFNLAAREDLSSLKARVDKLDVNKLKTVPADLSRISNAVDNILVKNAVYDKLVAKLIKLIIRYLIVD